MWFKTKKEIELQKQVDTLSVEVENLENKITKLNIEKRRAESECENIKQDVIKTRTIIRKIENETKTPKGTIKQLVEMRLNINNIIKELFIDY